MSDPSEKQPPASSTLLDLGPVAVFALVYKLRDVYWATGAFMVAVTAALIVAYVKERRLRPMPLVTAAIVLVFGGLTIGLGDPRFIYVKPTLVAGLSGLVLLVGLAFRKPLLKPLLGSALALTPEGWRALSLRFGLFSLVLAALNEAVWRSATPHAEHMWVWFKLLGIPGLTLLFLVAQTPLMRRFALDGAP